MIPVNLKIWLIVFTASMSASASSLLATEESARSVVQIRCATQNGEMKATGFVWPESGYVVTALHAVAGCTSARSVVYSEHQLKGTTIEDFVAVDLEADLALIKLEQELGLAPVSYAEEPPDLGGNHLVWGYPLAAEQMIGLKIEFALGLNRDVMTLGRAFSSSDLTKLFRNQDYPTRDTQILRVTTTIQPGHSGAPIFDGQGRLVAIADGGLLGGWRGINWSIPAHIYLPDLPDSKDPIPQNISEQAELFSAYAIDEVKTIGMGDSVDKARDADWSATLVENGLVPLPLVLDVLGVAEDDDMSWMIKDLDDILPQHASWEAFKFKALQSIRTGDLVFVPERAIVDHDPNIGFVEARSIDGSAYQVSLNYRGKDFEDSLRNGSRLFFERMAEMGAPDTPEVLPDDAIDRQLEYVDFFDSLGDENKAQATHYAVQINGDHFSGVAIHIDRSLDNMSDADYVDYLMMDLASFDLNGLWPLDEQIEKLLGSTASFGNDFAPEPSSLTLVRRVPLLDVAKDFVAAQDFEWKSDLSYLKSRLDDPQQIEQLSFDVYEDRLTGATIAVPSGLELVWDGELGAVKGSMADGKLQLAIAIQQAASFRAALGAGIQKYLSQLDNYADWADRAPTDCELSIYSEDREADCWDYFSGADARSGEFADLYLALNVQDFTFLGTSVYIIGDEDDLTDDEAVGYLMMLIGAEHLSDFAAK